MLQYCIGNVEEPTVLSLNKWDYFMYISWLTVDYFEKERKEKAIHLLEEVVEGVSPVRWEIKVQGCVGNSFDKDV